MRKICSVFIDKFITGISLASKSFVTRGKTELCNNHATLLYVINHAVLNYIYLIIRRVDKMQF